MVQNTRFNNAITFVFALIFLVSAGFAIGSIPKLWKQRLTKVEGTYTLLAKDPTYNKNVYILIYNPVLNNGKKLTENQNGWKNPDTLAAQYIDWLKETTNDKVNFTIVMRNEISSFTTFADGRKYDETTYLACLNDTSKCMKDSRGDWMMMDYPNTLNSIGVCNYFNSGAIDEIWMFGAPYMGFWEANQAGTNSYFTNGPVVSGTSCNKPMTIMGFSYERGVPEMGEDLIHRAEGTMRKVYGSLGENRMDNNWDKFRLNAYESPKFGFSGCGWAHYAPNSTKEYQWDSTLSTSTYCDEFQNYPEDLDTAKRKTVNCSEWGCTALGYFEWWLQHLPSKGGIAPDGKYADWWKYVLEPNSVYDTLKENSTISITPVTDNNKPINSENANIKNIALSIMFFALFVISLGVGLLLMIRFVKAQSKNEQISP